MVERASSDLKIAGSNPAEIWRFFFFFSIFFFVKTSTSFFAMGQDRPRREFDTIQLSFDQTSS